MKFSLKNLMWSVTLASAGVAAPAMAIRFLIRFLESESEHPQPIFMLLVGIGGWSCGPLLGAAVGNLFHKPMEGLAWGFVIQMILSFVIVVLCKFFGVT